MAKSIMDDETKRLYNEALLRICKDESLKMYTRDDVLCELEKYLDKNLVKRIEKTKLSRDLKRLNIRRMRIGEVLLYRYDKNMMSEEKYPVEFYNYITGNVNSLGANIRMIKIPVKSNSENIVCEKIYEYFDMLNIICIPAYKSVCVITNKRYSEKLKNIKDELNIARNER